MKLGYCCSVALGKMHVDEILLLSKKPRGPTSHTAHPAFKRVDFILERRLMLKRRKVGTINTKIGYKKNPAVTSTSL